MHPLTYYVDESVKKADGKEICAIITIKTIEPSKLSSLIRDSINGIISDPVLSQHNGIDDIWIPHYCNDHIEVQSRFLEKISCMPFEAYIVFGCKNNFDQYDEYAWYDNLLKILFSYRLSADKGRIYKVMYEQHDSKRSKREAHIQTLFQTMVKKDANKRRTEPSEIQVVSCSKDELPLCLPDYIGGSFISYLCETDSQKLGQKRRKFQQIEKKVRWIKDVDTKKIYTSRQPFNV